MKTISISAFKCNPAGDCLVAIQPGIPARDALDHASLFLSNVVGLLDSMADDDRTHTTEAACHMATLAKALIDAVEVPHE